MCPWKADVLLEKTHCRYDVSFACYTSLYIYASRAVSWLKSCELVIKESPVCCEQKSLRDVFPVRGCVPGKDVAFVPCASTLELRDVFLEKISVFCASTIEGER